MATRCTKGVLMKTLRSLEPHLLCVILILSPVAGLPQALNPVQLPRPQTDIGRPLMQTLRDRSSARAFSPTQLPSQTLSNLLWAAFGVNRPDSGKRTAPSAMNWQETDIYIAAADGLYIYDAKTHQLDPVSREDVRARTGMQPFVKDAPLNLVYVVDLAKTGSGSTERDMYVAADVGFIAQNVYLFCASEGLVTVVRGSIDRPALSKVLRLRPDQKIILAQTVGYPKR
jgi:SagB-type dehydrogenase family enzyme